MDDLISREAALDAVNVGNLHRGIVDALQSIILDIPSIQQIPSKDAISREDALEAIAAADVTNGTEYTFTGKRVQAILNSLPTVTPKQRTGHWKPKSPYLDACDICGETVPISDYEYCPWCGAKMESEENHDE